MNDAQLFGHRLGESHSSASDIRASWPACVLWERA